MTIEINKKELNESISNSIAKFGNLKILSVYIGTAEDNWGVIDVKENTRNYKRWRKIGNLECNGFGIILVALETVVLI